MSITVHCTHCQTGFPVDPAKVPEGGVRVRCTECQGIFRVEKPAAEPEATAPVTMETQPSVAPDGEPVGMEPVVQDLPDPQVDTPEPMAEDTSLDEAPFGTEAGFEESATGFDEVEPAVETEPRAGETTFEVETEPEEMASAPETDPAAPADEEGLSEDPDEWIFETEESFDPDALDVEPMDTVEGQVRSFQSEDHEPADEGIGPVLPGREEETFAGYARSEAAEVAEPATGEEVEHERVLEEEVVPPVEAEPTPREELSGPSVEEAPVESGPGAPEPPVTSEPETAPEVDIEPVPETPPVEEASPAAPKAFRFGRRDPKEKAKRLARVLVSDMITYNPERHKRALENDTLEEDFEEEIEKSWEEYTEQVGEEIARDTDYWTQALNDILAKGKKVF